VVLGTALQELLEAQLRSLRSPHHTPCAKEQLRGANRGISREGTCLLHVCFVLARSVLWFSPTALSFLPAVLHPYLKVVQLSGPSAGSHTGRSKARPSLLGRSCSRETVTTKSSCCDGPVRHLLLPHPCAEPPFPNVALGPW